MRRQDKEITSRESIDHVIAQAGVCRLGLCRDNVPYVVPVSFGYDGTCIYFHTAAVGMKIDYLQANNRVCFEFEHDVHVIAHETAPCSWSQSFYSVIGFGTVQEITDPERRVYALNQVMQHYSGREWEFPPGRFAEIRHWCISIESITGKQSLDKTRL